MTMRIMRYRLIVLMLLLGVGQEIKAQVNRQAAFIKRVTDTIAYVGVLKCELVSRAAYMPRQYIRFDSLRKQCSNEELQTLLAHKSPAVRGYAFWALTERPEVDLYPLLLRHRRDTKKYAQLCGCIGSTQTVIDGMLYEYGRSSRFTSDMLVPERKKGMASLEQASSQRFYRRHRRERHMTRT
ncbi:hypothetical protein [Hymenobacter swuensis]|uniref:hypothetical protein n=1 Tax=Hymenobacter swuensis TaxID=1446467 RepID=UPI0005C5BCD2|nr:hypothetical protein [Hymenobacter swuensis]